MASTGHCKTRQGGAAVARGAHNPDVAGSNPAPVTDGFLADMAGPIRSVWSEALTLVPDSVPVPVRPYQWVQGAHPLNLTDAIQGIMLVSYHLTAHLPGIGPLPAHTPWEYSL